MLDNPKKLKIKVLSDIFEIFYKLISNKSEGIDFWLSFDKNDERTRKHTFSYDGKLWNGTTRSCIVDYMNKKYKAVNWKLPNDGFLYDEEYLDDESYLKINEETNSLVLNVIRKMKISENFTRRVHYKINESRLEFIFEDNVNLKLISLKFEYGTYIGYENEPIVTVAEYKAMLILMREQAKIKNKNKYMSAANDLKRTRKRLRRAKKVEEFEADESLV